MRIIPCLLLCFISTVVISQNLVPNGSFETYINCPTGNSQLGGNVPPWVLPPGSGTTPDYLNACVSGLTGCNDVDVPNNYGGNASAFDGNAYAGIISVYTFCPNCREYIQVPLSAPMTAGQDYIVSMRVMLGSYSFFATDNIGIHISSGAVSQPANQPINTVTPQVVATFMVDDTVNWTLISGIYQAVGGEDFLTIGNFSDDFNTKIDTPGITISSCALAYAAAFYYIDSVTVAPVNASPAPVVSFISSDTVFCDKKCIDFTDLSSNNPTSWLWLFPGAVPATDTVQNPASICYNAYGTFDVTLIACNGSGCDTLLVPSLITEYQIPPQPSVFQSNDTLYCLPSAYSYAWYDAGNPGVVISTDSFFTTSTGGSFFVIVGDSLGCLNSSSVFLATGTHEQTWFNETFSMYPNPASTDITVEINAINVDPLAELRITDITGKTVFFDFPDKNRKRIQLGKLTNGIYFIRWKSAKYSIIHKLVIQN